MLSMMRHEPMPLAINMTAPSRQASTDVSPIGEYQQRISKSVSVADSGPSTNTATDSTPSPSLDKNGLPVAWIIQVGVFGNRDNALSLTGKLKKDGFKARVKVQQTSGRSLNWVSVGPYIDKSMALRDRDKIATSMKLAPEVLRFRP